ncbi:MAG: pyruvate dehydrogenase (acetyl-transferring) E1 component subunit alpha [Ardenticatenaceae bacterium]|nr:pyruvate dehydrogenase (acetyl-transferring) E1 component subunit alpha [Ardenticatenaceae bacterium]HBY98929.1 pyruvate dehydrogenase (acetyl-transferring) E1 component subunit alpha [Chloroflexota bacterium]
MATKTMTTDLTTEQLLDWYHEMVLIRRIEEEAANAYQHGHIGGFLHLYIGQEPVAVGAMAALREEDNVITHYRDHGHALARGMEPKAVMAELYGKSTGVSTGKGGSMHLADAGKHFWGGYAIVAGHIALADGIALADQYLGRDRVTLCIFGDGATNNGYFHESLNLGKVWDLPIIYMVENNLYGMGTAVERASAVEEIYRKACAYDIPSERVDGTDPIAVYEVVKNAVEHTRGGEGPYLIEAVTYRFRGHSMGDAERYRSKEEVEEAMRHDPINRFREYLQKERNVPAEQLDQIVDEAEREVQAAVRFAEESPAPEPEALWANIFANPVGENSGT